MERNQGPHGVRCLHAEQGDTVDALAQELAGLAPEAGAFWVLRSADGSVTGWVGCEFDVVQGRGWLRGPLLSDDAPDGGADALLQAVEAGPPSLACLDAFPNERAEELQALYERAGYRRMDVHRVMRAPLAGRELPADPQIRPATAADLPWLLALHRDLFPGSYLGDDEIAAALDGGKRRVLVTGLGYVVATDEPDMDEVYVDFLGVDPAARGAGLGRRLLEAAMSWGRERGRGHAALTVREDRLPAMALYLRCGFEQTSAGVHWRKARELPTG